MIEYDIIRLSKKNNFRNLDAENDYFNTNPRTARRIDIEEKTSE